MIWGILNELTSIVTNLCLLLKECCFLNLLHFYTGFIIQSSPQSSHDSNYNTVTVVFAMQYKSETWPKTQANLKTKETCKWCSSSDFIWFFNQYLYCFASNSSSFPSAETIWNHLDLARSLDFSGGQPFSRQHPTPPHPPPHRSRCFLWFKQDFIRDKIKIQWMVMGSSTSFC